MRFYDILESFEAPCTFCGRVRCEAVALMWRDVHAYDTHAVSFTGVSFTVAASYGLQTALRSDLNDPCVFHCRLKILYGHS